VIGVGYHQATAFPTPNPRPGAHATGLDGGKGAPPREASVPLDREPQVEGSVSPGPAVARRLR
jgi:hypothetical protein